MTDRSTPQYSLKDISRYFSGEMSAAEMHEMELASLNDPLLFDAMEGFREGDLDRASKDLADLKVAIGKDRGVINISGKVKNYTWWRIAAVVLIAAGLGVVINYMTGKQNKGGNAEAVVINETSQNTKKGSTDSLIALATPPLDTSKKIMSKTLPQQEEVLLSQAKPIPEPVPQNPAPAGAQLKAAAVDSEKTEEKTGDVSLMSKGMMQADAGNKKFNITFSGMVTDKMGKPLVNALIIAKDVAALYTNQKGNFAFNGPDQVVDIKVLAADYNSTNVAVNSDKFNVIKLSKDASLKRAATVSKLVAEGVSVMEDSDNAAMPAGGWQLFQLYVKEKVNILSDSVHENVSVRFKVDENGRPNNLEFSKPVSQPATEIVEALLKTGPAWITTGDERKASVMLKF